MEIRLRSQVSRNAKGYSIEATLDMGVDASLSYSGFALEAVGKFDGLSAFQIAALQEHLGKLGAAFPREE